MDEGRIKMLEKFANEDPSDPFPLYALALEYQSVDKVKAKALFDKLLGQFKEYLPTYYIAGSFYLKQDVSKAREIFEQGLMLAKQQNNAATQREIQAALDNMDE